MYNIKPILIAISLALLFYSPIFAAPNGLTQIPIAKVFGDGVASFSVSRSVQSVQSTTYTTQYGIANRFEVGVDFQASPADQQTFLTNVKYLIAHKPGSLPDIAVGMTNLATGQKAAPYAVATTQPRAFGVSLGIIRPNNADAFEGMAGLSYNLLPNLQLVSDYICGHLNYSTLGVIAGLTPVITVNLAYARPNSAAEPDGYIFNLAYTFHLKSSKSNQAGTANKNPTAGSGGQSK